MKSQDQAPPATATLPDGDFPICTMGLRLPDSSSQHQADVTTTDQTIVSTMACTNTVTPSTATSDATKPATVFHHFDKLPLEIRSEIWYLSAEVPWEIRLDLHCTGGCFSKQQVHGRASEIALVCKESRESLKQYYFYTGMLHSKHKGPPRKSLEMRPKHIGRLQIPINYFGEGKREQQLEIFKFLSIKEVAIEYCYFNRNFFRAFEEYVSIDTEDIPYSQYEAQDILSFVVDALGRFDTIKHLILVEYHNCPHRYGNKQTLLNVITSAIKSRTKVQKNSKIEITLRSYDGPDQLDYFEKKTRQEFWQERPEDESDDTSGSSTQFEVSNQD